MILVIAIPAYNEEHTIEDVLKKIPKSIDGITEVRVVVVNDGSIDGTKEIALKHGADVINHHRNIGVGKTMMDGIQYAVNSGADMLVTIDADGQFDPEDIGKLIKPIVNNEAEFVTCSRFLDKSLTPEMPLVNILGNKVLAWFVSVVTGVKVWDVSCGFRAYSKEVLLRLNLFGKLDCNQEMFISLAKHNVFAKEIPLHVYPTSRPEGKSRVVTNTLVYGVRLSIILLRAFRDINPFVFFGVPGVVLFVVGLGLYGFHWYSILQGITPILSNRLGTVGWVVGLIGFILILFALFADMVDRIRVTSEEAMYHLKKNTYEKE